MSQGDSGDLADIDMPTLLYRLPGVRFPADKDEVVRTAESNDAPRELVERVRYEKAAKEGATRDLVGGPYPDEHENAASLDEVRGTLIS
jgi:hypothetical protein